MVKVVMTKEAANAYKRLVGTEMSDYVIQSELEYFAEHSKTPKGIQWINYDDELFVKVQVNDTYWNITDFRRTESGE